MRVSGTDVAYFTLPLVLWPVSFILLKNIFIFALAGSTAILAALTLYRYKVSWLRKKDSTQVILAGIIAAFALYVFFVFGRWATNVAGLGAFVNSVYSSIYGSQGRGAITVLLLAIIGVFEEIYWRGGVQGCLESRSKEFKSAPWAASTAYYALVHIATLNPILVAAAMVVGLVAGFVAYRYGVLASIITHVIWIEAIVVFFPM